MADSGLELRSLITEEGQLELSLARVPVSTPGPEEVVIRVAASPINPSDLGLLFGPADMSTARSSEGAEGPVVTADVPPGLLRGVTARVGQSMPVGNEGAGIVVAAGDSDPAQALIGKTVAGVGGGMYTQFRVLKPWQCLELAPGTTPAEGASCFVNPLTALGMVETMRLEGHTALVHTAAASNLGQMLNRICLADGVDLVNIVRKPGQEALLRDIGAKYVVSSSSESFMKDLIAAFEATGATLAFDATGGGALAGQILTAMEAALLAKASGYSGYGSDTHKQVYIYGGLDRSPTVFNRNFGMAWASADGCSRPFSRSLAPMHEGSSSGSPARSRPPSPVTTARWCRWPRRSRSKPSQPTASRRRARSS